MAKRHGNGLASACHTLKTALFLDEMAKNIPSIICLARRRDPLLLLPTGCYRLGWRHCGRGDWPEV